VGNTPDYLSYHLGVSGDANDTRLKQVNLGLLEGSNFQEVEGCRIKKKKRNGG
jgi:hypothetical protein